MTSGRHVGLQERPEGQNAKRIKKKYTNSQKNGLEASWGLWGGQDTLGTLESSSRGSKKQEKSRNRAELVGPEGTLASA